MDADALCKLEQIEFYCSECAHYTYVNLRLLEGTHVMRCPNCGHEHYRRVKEGQITEGRWNGKNLPHYTIWAPKSACVPKAQRRKKGLIGKIRDHEAFGDMKENWGQ